METSFTALSNSLLALEIAFYTFAMDSSALFSLFSRITFLAVSFFMSANF